MKEQNKNIDAYFLEELGNITETPPASVWTSLEQRLDAQPRAKKIGWWFWPLLLIVLFSGSVIGYQAWVSNHTPATGVPAAAILSDPENRSGAGANPMPEDAAHPILTDNSSKELNTKNRSATIPNSNNKPAASTAHETGSKSRGSAFKPGASTSPAANSGNEAAGTTGNRKTKTQNFSAVNTKPLPAPGNSSASGEEFSGQVNAEPAGTHSGRPKAGQRTLNGNNSGPTGKNTKTANTTAARTDLPASGTNTAGNNNAGLKENKAPATSADTPASAGSGRRTAKETDRSKNNKNTAKGATKTLSDGGESATVPNKKQNTDITARENTDGTTTATGARAAATSKNTDKKPLAGAAPKANAGRPFAAQPAKNKLKALSIAPAKEGDKHPADAAAAKEHKPGMAANKPAAARPGSLTINPAKNDSKKPATIVPPKEKPALASGATPLPKKSGPAAASKAAKEKPGPPVAADTAAQTHKVPAADKTAGIATPKQPATGRTTPGTSKIKITDENGNTVVPEASLPKSAGKSPLAKEDPGATAADAAPKEDFLKQHVQEQEGGGGGGGASSPPSKPKKTNKTPRFEGGVKVGYETGASSYNATKYVAAAYLQYNITSRLGIAVQPAIKSAATNGNYQPQNNDSSYYEVTSTTHNMFDRKDTFYSFAFHQTFDSFVTKKKVATQYTEIDIPVMLKYRVDKHIVLSAGFNLTLGKIINLNTDLQTYKGLQYNDTLMTHGPDSSAPGNPSRYAHAGSIPFSSYVPSADAATNNPVRFGYTFGISYTFKERFMVDFMVQKTTSNQGYINDSKIRNLYAQHYFRLMFGYKLFGSRKKVREMP